jgi:cob(I)alamin adenosyltransferase
MLYTRRGDNGDTSLFGSGARLPKDDARIEALGAMDELNSLIGVCKTRAASNAVATASGAIKPSRRIVRILEAMQQHLFIVQAELAGADKHLTEEHVKALERLIDAIEKKLPPLRNFVLAGGSELAALLDYARAVARRAERRAVAAHHIKPLSPHTLAYLNRLSSALFALARLVNARVGREEQHPHY